MAEINIEQAQIEHSEILAHHVVAIIDQKNINIIDRIEKLEIEKSAEINIISGDINADSSEPVNVIEVNSSEGSETIIVPASIFTEESINLIDIDASQSVAVLGAELSAISTQLSNLEFLNG